MGKITVKEIGRRIGMKPEAIEGLPDAEIPTTPRPDDAPDYEGPFIIGVDIMPRIGFRANVIDER